MKIRRSEKFKREYKKLTIDIQQQFNKKAQIFHDNFKSPSLRIKKISGTENIWEFSINMQYRATFEKIEEGVLFRRIGDHEILKSP